MAGYSIREMPLVNKIDRAEKDLFALKSRQGVGGRTLATSITHGNNLKSDYQVDPFSGTQETYYKYGFIRFISDNQLNPYGQLYIDFIRSDGQTPFPISGDDTPRMWYFFQIPQEPDSRTCLWRIDARYSGNIGTKSHFFLRPTVAATDTGGIEWINSNDLEIV